jgi:hypothetical protein
VTTATYIPRFSENDYVANGWIKTDPDVIPLTQSNLDLETSPKQHDRSWTTNSTRIQTTYKIRNKYFLLSLKFSSYLEI